MSRPNRPPALMLAHSRPTPRRPGRIRRGRRLPTRTGPVACSTSGSPRSSTPSSTTRPNGVICPCPPWHAPGSWNASTRSNAPVDTGHGLVAVVQPLPCEPAVHRGAMTPVTATVAVPSVRGPPARRPGPISAARRTPPHGTCAHPATRSSPPTTPHESTTHYLPKCTHDPRRNPAHQPPSRHHQPRHRNRTLNCPLAPEHGPSTPAHPSPGGPHRHRPPLLRRQHTPRRRHLHTTRRTRMPRLVQRQHRTHRPRRRSVVLPRHHRRHEQVRLRQHRRPERTRIVLPTQDQHIHTRAPLERRPHRHQMFPIPPEQVHPPSAPPQLHQQIINHGYGHDVSF